MEKSGTATAIPERPTLNQAFPFQVELIVPFNGHAHRIMTSWCVGKAHRTVPPSPQPSQPVRWCFASADDAEFFQATFGGKLIAA
jgi:hypothetical protein